MTKFVMPTIELVEDYEPTSVLGRPSEPNPFDAHVTALAATWNARLNRTSGSLKLNFPAVDGERTRVTQKFGRAANNAGYTARFDDKANETVTAEDGTTVLAVFGVVCAYLVPQITRKRKGKGTTGLVSITKDLGLPESSETSEDEETPVSEEDEQETPEDSA